MLIALWALTALGCTEPPPSTGQGERFRVVERYGADQTRSVELTVSVLNEANSAIEFDEVEIAVNPSQALPVQKLETLLEDTGFKWHPGEATWPELARAVPPDVLPMVHRLQLAILLLKGPANFEISHPYVTLFTGMPTFGLTRVTRQDGQVTMQTLALALTPEDSTFARARLEGTMEEGVCTLKGTRHVGKSPAETVSFTVSRPGDSSGQPAAVR